MSNSELFDSLFGLNALDADGAVVRLGDRVYWSRGDLSPVEGDEVGEEGGEEWHRVLIQTKPPSQLSPGVRLCSQVGDKQQHLEGKFQRRDQ